MRRRKPPRRVAKCRSARSSRSAKRVVAQAGNRTRELNDPTAHAEMLAIRAAAAALSAERLGSADLYVTLEPCTMCAAAISFARIRRLYFGAADEKGGAVVSGVRFFAVADLSPCARDLSRHRRNAIGRPAARLLPRAARLTTIRLQARPDHRPLFTRPAAAGLPSAEAFHPGKPRTELARPISRRQAGQSRGHPTCPRVRISDAGAPPLR